MGFVRRWDDGIEKVEETRTEEGVMGSGLLRSSC